MNIQSSNMDYIHRDFLALPEKIQQEKLALIDKVNEQHLHCEDQEVWRRAHYLMTYLIAIMHEKKMIKLKQRGAAAMPIAIANGPQAIPAQDSKANPQINPMPLADSPVPLAIQSAPMVHIDQNDYIQMLQYVRDHLNQTFFDPLFTDPILEALQQHILTPFSDHHALAMLLCNWITLNAMYLPLGTHLLKSFEEDMAGTSSFARCEMFHQEIDLLPEALSQKTIGHMKAFLAEAAQSNTRSCTTYGHREEQLTAIMLSVKNGAGGHTAPTQAMEKRLTELGWKVMTIHYDEHLSPECDPYQLLGITFEDGSKMTETLISTRWIMQKHKKDACRIVSFYVRARQLLTPNLFKKDSGGDLLRKTILPLKPRLFITTLAYHWIWRSLAYRIPGAKTLLAASDVFFHREAVKPWLRQKSIDPKLRQIHFTAMTNDLDLLKSIAVHHDNYYRHKHPEQHVHSMRPLFSELCLDNQISVIGAPIHPAFDAIHNLEQMKNIRKKWGVPNGALSICISRGKLGYDSDLMPALEGYRTTEILPQPVIIHVVCGENTSFYNRLLSGEYKDLGPNITVKPYPLLAPKEFAELRAISLDDIKAGGGSSFEGWYLISKGIVPSMLLLTPGPDLWWERSNCDAMEKWGIGRTIPENTSKIEIIKDVIFKGFPTISHRFPDWKPPFDKVVDLLAKEKK